MKWVGLGRGRNLDDSQDRDATAGTGGPRGDAGRRQRESLRLVQGVSDVSHLVTSRRRDSAESSGWRYTFEPQRQGLSEAVGECRGPGGTLCPTSPAELLLAES